MSREALIIKTENYSHVHQQVNMQTVPLSIQQSITNNKKKNKTMGTHNNTDDSKALQKEARHKRIYTAWFHLYEILEM